MAHIFTEFGQFGGKMQLAQVTIREGKNLGKSNETTVYDQATLEAESKWLKQLDKGYRQQLDSEVLEDAVSKSPMLAHDYQKHKDKVKFPAHIQPKLDGMRCIARKVGQEVVLYSRKGKIFATVPHINSSLNKIMRDGEVWDGELYIHGVPFQKIASWIKRAQPDSLKISYHVYDCISDLPFDVRYESMQDKIGKYYDDFMEAIWQPGMTSIPFPPVASVITRTVVSHEEVKEYHDQFVGHGYEGAILRHNGCPYKEGYRSPNLLKVKEFMEEEFEIVGVSEGKGKFEGMAIFRLKTKTGGEFDCMPEGDEQTRSQYWKDRKKMIGKLLTVRFFEWSTSEVPVPRFPIGKTVRDYE